MTSFHCLKTINLDVISWLHGDYQWSSVIFMIFYYHLERTTRQLFKRSKICCAIFLGPEIVTCFNVKIIGLTVVLKDE
jgi:hypothetical protein